MVAYSKLSNDDDLKLNSDQQRVFNTVLKAVKTPNKAKPLVLFVCGPAGTGKSVLVKRLLVEIGIQHVIVTASTAMAGKNIGARTIHSVLNLNPKSEAKDDDRVPPHSFLKLLIIDEISMCDANLFRRIEKRMRQLLRNDNVFGGCTVVLFGDLLQIPPVKGEWIFKSPLWKNLVQYEELEIVMRQENDPKFAKMLKRWRLGMCNREDRIFLNRKAMKVRQGASDYAVEYFEKQYDVNRSSMVLAFTNPTIGLLNRKITYKFFKEHELFNIVTSLYSCQKNDRIPTKTHTNIFRIGLGSRIMVNKNINSKLVNGTIGIVRDIESDDESRVTRIQITTPPINSRCEIPLSEEKIIGGVACETWKVGFSIQPAYAVTYHKAQGQTLDDVFLLGKRGLPPALFYVGASRVRTSDGLHILNLGAGDSIHADPDALEEYKKLRVSIGKTPLPDIE